MVTRKEEQEILADLDGIEADPSMQELVAAFKNLVKASANVFEAERANDPLGELEGKERDDAVLSIRLAKHGDFRMVANRVRKRIACGFELDMAAAALMGKLKHPARRPKSWQTTQRHEAFQRLVLERICDGDKFDFACEAVAKEGKVSKTTIYNSCGGLRCDSRPDFVGRY